MSRPVDGDFVTHEGGNPTPPKREVTALRDLRDEMRAVIDHFTERPVIEGKATEEDARWIMRYDRLNSQLRKAGLL